MATKTEETTGQALLALLGKASAADLAELDQRIQQLQNEIDQLSAVRKLIDIKVNGKPERKKAGPRKAKPSANGTPDLNGSPKTLIHQRRRQIAAFIAQNGATSAGVICNRLDIPSGSLTATFNCEFFKQSPTGTGWVLTEAGRKMLEADVPDDDLEDDDD